MPTNVDNPIQIVIRRIVLLNYLIDEALEKELGTEMDFTVTQNTKFNISEESAKFAITFSYIYKETREKPIEITVLTEFQLKDFAKVQDFEDKMNNNNLARIPREVLITCLSLSLTHTRTLLSQNIASSIFMNKIPWPIFDPQVIADALYPGKDLYTLDKNK